MAHKTLLKGRILSFDESPFESEPSNAATLCEALVIEDGCIAALGAASELALSCPELDFVQKSLKSAPKKFRLRRLLPERAQGVK